MRGLATAGACNCGAWLRDSARASRVDIPSATVRLDGVRSKRALRQSFLYLGETAPLHQGRKSLILTVRIPLGIIRQEYQVDVAHCESPVEPFEDSLAVAETCVDERTRIWRHIARCRCGRECPKRFFSFDPPSKPPHHLPTKRESLAVLSPGEARSVGERFEG